MVNKPIVRLHHYEWLCKTISPVAWEGNNNTWEPDVEDWKAIIYLASTNLVLPTLYQALKNKNLIQGIPFEVSEALIGFNQLRNQSYDTK